MNVIGISPSSPPCLVDVDGRLYFEELGFERVMDIYEMERASGVVVSVGGQLPQNIALKLKTSGAKVLGTAPEMIDSAEDRYKFSKILDSVGVDQPAWKELSSVDAARKFAEQVGYPVLVRPSYVLSGAAMSVIHDESTLQQQLTNAAAVSPDHPVVITKFIQGAREIDVDGVASNGDLIVHAVSEHVENAGVHSGDATLVLPPVTLEDAVVERVKEIAQKVAKALQITGPFNMQIIQAENPEDPSTPLLKVIECNLRASRSFPFVSKVLGTNFIDVATRALVGKDVPEPMDPMKIKRDYTAVKVAQFSWTRLAGADPYLGVEMASTGEVACFGRDVREAYWAALQSTQNFRVPKPGNGILLGGDITKPEIFTVATDLAGLGYKLFAVSSVVKGALEETGLAVDLIEFPKTDKRKLREVFQKYNIDAVINLASERGKTMLDEDYVMRRNSVDFNVPLVNDSKVSHSRPDNWLTV